MQKQRKIKVIGIGPNGECFYLDEIYSADILAGGKRLLNFFKNVKCEKIVLDKNLRETLNELKGKDSKIVILASQDPLYFGIGKSLIEIFGQDNLEFYPYLNSVQLLCAKAKINYEDFVHVSFHGREINEKTIGKIKFNSKIAVLTDKKNNIKRIAKVLIKYLPENTKIILGQMIGTKNENIVETDLISLLKIKPTSLDTFLIFNEHPYKIDFGIDENEYFHSAGLITKKEIRAVTLSYLNLQKDSILWDIGAGSGAVSIEAGNFCYEGKVYAIEKDEERVKLIKKNIKKFKTHNVYVVHGKAPEILKNLETPDRIFIGGFSGNFLELLELLYKKFKGIVVANLVSIEKLNILVNFSVLHNLKFSISSLQVNNLNEIGDNHYFKSQNQVYICKIEFI